MTKSEQARDQRRSLPWRSLILFAIALAATIAFVAIADELREGDLDRYDTAVATAVHTLSHPVLDVLMIALTDIGTGPILCAAIIATCIWAYRRGRRSYVLFLVANTVLAMTVNPLLKSFFTRARPTLFEVIKRPDTYSFPSGHSMSAVMIYGSIATVAIALRPQLRPFVIPAALLLILGIGFSRVYLGAHWPFDVLAGWISGIPFLIALVHLVHRYRPATA